MKMRYKNEEPNVVTFNKIILTELYGKTAIDYGNSEEYINIINGQRDSDKEFIDSRNLDADCQDVRDAYYKSYELLEKKIINSQSADHHYTNQRIEELAKREISMMTVLENMLEENNRFIKEVL